MFNTLIGEFCATHDNWRELLSNEPYNLKISEDGLYVLFKYNQLTSDFSNPLVREARGIIFKECNWKHPVCRAFDKFGNYGEPYAAEIDWSTAFVTEKIDGSLIKVWWDWNGGWHISTNGTIDAYKADLADTRFKSFGELFETTLKEYYSSFEDFVENLDVDYTYMFELVSPYNRVVVPYDKPAIYFLGARNKITVKEYLCSEDNMKMLGVDRFERPKQYQLNTLEDCIKIANEFDWDQEGFVVTDINGNRVKVKSPEYIKAHYARTSGVITNKRLIKIILDNEVEEFLCYASDYRDRLEYCKNMMMAFHNVSNSLLKTYRALVTKLSKKEYAELVRQEQKIYQKLLFNNYSNTISAEDYTSSWDENKWAACIEALEDQLNKLFTSL